MDSRGPEFLSGLGLIEGFHGPKPELSFVTEVVNGIIRPAGYQGPYQLVGSRSEGLWLSRTRFPKYSRTDQAIAWYSKLNKLAHENNLTRANLNQLLDIIEGDIPTDVEEFLEDDPGSDYDIFLPKGIPDGIESIYEDNQFGTGQSIDIYGPESEI